MISAKLSVVLTDINSEIKRKNDVNQDAESFNLNLSEKSIKYKNNKKLPKNKNKKFKTEQIMESKDLFEVELKKNSFATGGSFKDFMYVQEHDPGGGKTLHCFYEDVKDLPNGDYQKFVDEFLDLALSEVMAFKNLLFKLISFQFIFQFNVQKGKRKCSKIFNGSNAWRGCSLTRFA